MIANSIILGGSGTGIELLWENSNPTSSYTASLMTFDGTYTGYYVILRYSTSNSTEQISYIDATQTGQIQIGTGGIRESFVYSLQKVDVYNISQNTIQIGSGTSSYCIPVKIWGVIA